MGQEYKFLELLISNVSKRRFILKTPSIGSINHIYKVQLTTFPTRLTQTGSEIHLFTIFCPLEWDIKPGLSHLARHTPIKPTIYPAIYLPTYMLTHLPTYLPVTLIFFSLSYTIPHATMELSNVKGGWYLPVGEIKIRGYWRKSWGQRWGSRRERG